MPRLRLAHTAGWEHRTFRALESFPTRMDLWKEWELIYQDYEDPDHEITADEFYRLRRGAMQQTVDRAIRALDPGAVIAIGIAFGVDESRQNIGDILLSNQLRPYELQRIGKDRIVLRGPRPEASPRLLNHFDGFAQAKWKGAPVKSGVMLTGEKLIDNVDYRSQLLGFESEAIGGEMEGAGLYASGYDHKVDWIVLKAICDFADGNKGQNKEERQMLAAQNAAQFLLESLQYAPLQRQH
jgi:nucleoside phosphorylase